MATDEQAPAAPVAAAGPPRVKLRLLREGAEPPRYMTEHAAGADLFAANEAPIVIPPGGRALVPVGFALELPPGFEAQVRPRSGLALKHGVTCLNSPGTIDADYRGEVGVLLANLGSAPFDVVRGMRIAQLVVAEVARPVLEVVEALGETARGAGGFGHTGGTG